MTLRTRRLGIVTALALCAALLVPATASAVPVGTPKIGLVCTPGTVVGTNHTFNLRTGTGYVQTPDGNSVFMWGFADVNDPDPGLAAFQFPGPNLCVTQGETVVVNLTNTLPEATSIVFPGQDAAVTPSGGAPGLLATEAAAAGGTVSYSFLAGSPGTYLYESGSDIAKQVEMGLYGALIIRPLAAPNLAYDGATQFDPTREYAVLLSEVDSDLHHAVETGGIYDFNALHNRYYFVNGRAFPDTLQDNGSALLPTQPYGALVRMQPTNGSGQPSLIRMLNAGTANHPFHPHGNHLVQIAQDGRPIKTSTTNASTERFGETIGSGQTQDYLLRWDDVDFWSPVLNPLPVSQPSFLNLVFKDGNTWYSGSPYLGYKGTLPTGTNSLNVCGEWFFPWHSHALNEFANFDEPFGGMATLLRIDPLGGCFAAPTATTISAGTLNSGTVAALSAVDTSYYRINSTTSGTRTTDWYARFGGVPAGATNLKATYVGKNTFAPSTQNFNTLASTGATGTTLPAGWAFSESGAGANGTYAIGNGSSATPNTYSFGATGTTDRAFGTLRGNNSLASIVGAAFTNTTGSTITSLAISYTGEQWRYGGGGAAGADHIDFSYSTNATNLTNGTWTPVTALNFYSPVTTGAARALDGNTAANRSTVTSTITGLSIPNGATYRIRWTDFDRAGSGDDGLAVDDFSLSPAGAATFPTTLSIWNWTTSTWSQFAGPTPIGATDVTINGVVPGPWASYIGTGTNRGSVRIRVLTTGGTANFVTNANFLQLVYDAP